MPIEIKVDQSRELTIFHCTGTTSRDDVESAMTVFYRKIPTRNTLWDFRQASINLTGADIVDLARRFELLVNQHLERRQGGKTVAVTPSDLDFGLARMYESHAAGSPLTYHVCRTWEEAIDWLDR
jgi:hypothetical protein